jgi:hypothetical protein
MGGCCGGDRPEYAESAARRAQEESDRRRDEEKQRAWLAERDKQHELSSVPSSSNGAGTVFLIVLILMNVIQYLTDDSFTKKAAEKAAEKAREAAARAKEDEEAVMREFEIRLSN